MFFKLFLRFTRISLKEKLKTRNELKKLKIHIYQFKSPQKMAPKLCNSTKSGIERWKSNVISRDFAKNSKMSFNFPHLPTVLLMFCSTSSKLYIRCQYNLPNWFSIIIINLQRSLLFSWHRQFRKIVIA